VATVGDALARTLPQPLILGRRRLRSTRRQIANVRPHLLGAVYRTASYRAGAPVEIGQNVDRDRECVTPAAGAL